MSEEVVSCRLSVVAPTTRAVGAPEGTKIRTVAGCQLSVASGEQKRELMRPILDPFRPVVYGSASWRFSAMEQIQPVLVARRFRWLLMQPRPPRSAGSLGAKRLFACWWVKRASAFLACASQAVVSASVSGEALSLICSCEAWLGQRFNKIEDDEDD